MKRHSTTIVITMLICLAIACTKKNTSPDVKPRNLNEHTMAYASGGADSPFICIDSANKMLNSYLNSANATDVHSLIIDGQALRYYLLDTSIKRVKLMFAHRLSYINNGGLNQNAGNRYDAITIIVAGFNANNNYVYSAAGTVVDNAMPCPYNCPPSGTASSDLLPQ